MVLKFFGRDTGFGEEHTSAYFITEKKEMVLIDCPVSTFQKLKHMDLSEYEHFYVYVTHTHGDHIGGLGLFVQYAYFTLKKIVTIVAPSMKVFVDIEMLLEIEGNDEEWYECLTADEMGGKWGFESILTEHSPQLKGKCYGYRFNIDNQNIVYTGDTSTLKPFMPYLKEGSILYVDTSVYYGLIHLKLEDALEDFIKLNEAGIKVYLMHLDDVAKAEEVVANYPDINVVKLA